MRNTNLNSEACFVVCFNQLAACEVYSRLVLRLLWVFHICLCLHVRANLGLELGLGLCILTYHPHLQCIKAERVWYLFSHKHDVIDKWQKIPEWKGKSYVLHIVQPTTSSTLGVYDSRPPLARYMWYLSSSCCFEPQCAHVQLSPFYHLSTLDIMPCEMITKPTF